MLLAAALLVLVICYKVFIAIFIAFYYYIYLFFYFSYTIAILHTPPVILRILDVIFLSINIFY